MQPNTIICGDALAELKKMPDECVDCIITSPPYWGLRDYGVEGQLGLEKTPQEFVANMTGIFSECRRVLKKEGTLWLNIGDSYVGTGNKSTLNGEYRDPKYKNGRNGQGTALNFKVVGLKSKDMVGIPWMLAFALRADGWYLRQDIIWHKPNPIPESVTDRCTKAHEYIFLLSKSLKYYFDNGAIAEDAKPESAARYNYDFGGAKNEELKETDQQHTRPIGKRAPKEYAAGGTGIVGHSGNRKPNGEPYDYAITGKRNRRSVWTINTYPYKEAHFATFPERLVEPMVLAGSPKGGMILDPFSGAATTGLVAKKLGRNYIGIELNPEYVALSERRLNNIPSPMF